jgi:hypothetical protein
MNILLKIKNRFRLLLGSPFLFYLAHPWALGRGIVEGPFKDTRMSLRTSWNAPICLFVGAYEKELHPIWDNINPQRISTVWVIGAAEGYYACGFAKKWGVKVLAYETSDISRAVLLKNIKLNGVEENVEIFGKCEPADFKAGLERQAPDLILCDIEGGEDVLFSDEILGLLGKTKLVVELHPPYGLRERVKSLMRTHEVQIIDPVQRTLADYPYDDWIPPEIKLKWLNEGWPFSTPWLIAFPRVQLSL